VPGSSIYSREDKLKAIELAAVHGPRPTARMLKIPWNTLKTWLYESFQKEYAEFRAGKVSEWRAAFAAEMEDLAQNYGETERKALEVAQRQLDDPNIEPKDVASLIKGMGAARASASQTGAKARGEPDEIHQHQIAFPQLEAIEAALRQANVIEGSIAEPAQLPAAE
jgi:hypothetical protein